jgi:tRNA threonylcarbamoyladenosine biosynthesis protein TsaB
MTQPRLLLLETSGRGGFVALAEGGSLLGERSLLEARCHARSLVPLTAELLRSQGWKPRDIGGVAVSIGPGSYTGLRVGLMAAKTLCYATGCVLLGVETFAVIAGQAPAEAVLVDVLADAQQEKVYVQSFRGGPLTPLQVVPLADWLAKRDPAAQVSGPGVAVYAERLAGLPLIAESQRIPAAEGLLRIAQRRFLAGERDDLWTLEPIYLRPSAAEEQWSRKSSQGSSGR